MAAQHAGADATPLLAGQDDERRPAECVLHKEECFLSKGKASGGSHATVQRKLIIACALCFVFMIIEVIGGWLARRCGCGWQTLRERERWRATPAPCTPSMPKATTDR